MPSHPSDPTLPGPRSLTELYWSFTGLALQGFGGVLAVVQRELVDKRRWLTREQFVEEWSVAQVLPGPNVVNLSLMLGDRFLGPRGALVAVAGMLSFPLVIALALLVAFSGVQEHPGVQGALRGMGAVAAGLITASGIKLIPALRRNSLGAMVNALLATATFVAVALLRLPLAWVILGLGLLACGWAYRVLTRLDGRA